MDMTLIAIAIFIFIAVVFIVLFLFKSINNKSFRAEDGSVFTNQSDLDVYQNLYEKTKPIFVIDDEKNPNEIILGFQKPFLTKLTKDGFQDLKTLIKYRKQFISLSELINS